MLKFQLEDVFLNISGEDPFQYVTLASVCTKIYMYIIPEKTIGILNANTFEEVQSQKAIQWLEYLSNNIQHAKEAEKNG